MRGELDWIVMKALEKDRNRRYETANGLAADLRRYLDDEAVQACPPTAAYRLSKFAKKYRVVLATACAFVAVLVAATVISLWQAVRANRARAEAVMAYAAENQQRREAQDQRDRAFKAEEDAKANLARARAAVDDYLTTISESRLLKSPLPGLQPLRKELLTTALKYYEDFVSQNRDDPVLQADLAAATLRVGEITDQIGSKEEALKAFQTALSMYESLAGADLSPSNRSYRAGQGRCLVRMAMIQDNQGQSDESLSMFETIHRLCWISSIATSPATRRFAPIWPSPTITCPSDAHEAGKLGRGDTSPASGDRSSQGPRRGVPEAVVVSYRPGVELEQSGCDPARATDKTAEAFDSVRRANAIQRTLVEEHPEDPQLRHTLALSTRGWPVILKFPGPMEGEQAAFRGVGGDHEPGRRRESGRHRVPEDAGDQCLGARPVSHRPRRDRCRIDRPRQGTRSSGDGPTDEPQ